MSRGTFAFVADRFVALYLLILLAAAYPVVFLIRNIDYFPPSSISLGLLASLVLTGVIYLMCLAVIRNSVPALWMTLIVSVAFWGFNSGKDLVAMLLSQWPGSALSNAASRDLAIGLASFVSVGLCAVVYYCMRGRVSNVHTRLLLGIFLHCLLILPLLGLAADRFLGTFAVRGERASASPLESPSGSNPDIYYIILDGYGRADILDSLYGYDNRPFIGFLEREGFYVAHRSHSNYTQTALSLASSLNMDYLDNLLNVSLLRASISRNPLHRVIEDSQVRHELSRRGYRFVVVDSGFRITRIDDADVLLTSAPKRFGDALDIEVLLALVEMSPVSTFVASVRPMGSKKKRNVLSRLEGQLRRIRSNRPVLPHGGRIVYSFNAIKTASELPGPKMVFAHIVCPHPPFIFGPRSPLDVYKPSRGNWESFSIGLDELGGAGAGQDARRFKKGYAGQIEYANRQMENIIPLILAHNPNSVIIVQADHGPDLFTKWDTLEVPIDRFYILNAYYFPDRNYQDLYAAITPVNSFRVVLNKAVGTSVPLLPDKAMFSPLKQPYQFTDMTAQLPK